MSVPTRRLALTARPDPGAAGRPASPPPPGAGSAAAALAAAALALSVPAAAAAPVPAPGPAPDASGTEAAALRPVQQAPAEGQWRGSIQTPGGALQVVVDLKRSAAGSWEGQIDIPAQGVENRDLGEVSVRGDSAAFSIPGVPGGPTFRGTVSAAGDSLTGTFSQGGGSFPFALERAGAPELVAGPSPEQALEGYGEMVREAMDAWHVPGAAVAVVKDGEVVLARGYGVRSRETGAPVTDSTLFPIGSMTKSFTSLLVGTLVEEGKLAWDEPVRDRLPAFRLEGEYASDHATPVDLLSHRTGLPRHDLLWLAREEAGRDVSRADYLRRLRHLPTSEEFRTAFQYNNFMFLAAGRLAAEVTGRSWEQLVRRRFLEPLGMERTTFWVDSMTARPDHAAGYRVTRPDSGEAEVKPVDYFRIDAMGPAGSLNSSVSEMAGWLELHMDGGEVDGERVAPSSAVEATHRRRIPVHGPTTRLLTPPEMPHLSYALGWMVQNYRGHVLLHHGGGIHGFTSLMGVLPEDEVGVAILTNRTGGAFTYAVMLNTFDRMLGLEEKEWTRRFQRMEEQAREAAASGEEEPAADTLDAPPPHDLGAYAGGYRHPGYGPLRVKRGKGGLTAELGVLGFDLEHRHYDVFEATADDPLLEDRTLAFQFETNRAGDVSAVTVPLQDGVDAIRFARQPPDRMRDPEFLEGLAGTYEVAGMTVEVRMRGEHTLVFEQPGATAELIPYRGAQFRVDGQESTTVEFVREDGRATAIVIRQAGRSYRGERKE